MHCIPQDAMVDQIVAVDEVISCVRDVLPGDIIAAMLEFVWKLHAFADDLDASLQRGRCLPICQEGVERVDGTQCAGLVGRIANLRQRDSRVTTAHESS